MEQINSNIPLFTVDQFASRLCRQYVKAVNKGKPLHTVPTPFLWGPPGVGKSQGVRQLAQLLGQQLGKTVNVTDVRLLLFTPADLQGVPVADLQNQVAVWLKPKIFQMDPSDTVVNLLFLDELSAAPQSVQAAAYQITLDRVVGEHKLPDNCIVIAAGNRTTDLSVSYAMPKALCNRLCHMEVKPDADAWRSWALRKGIDPRILGYLAFDSAKLCVQPSMEDMAYPTPRSWEFVSHLIEGEEDLEDLRPEIGSRIGMDTALAFTTWCRVYQDLPSVEEVLEGICSTRPTTYDALHAFAGSLVHTVRQREETITMEQLDNLFTYIKPFPADFAYTIVRDLAECPRIHLLAMRSTAAKGFFAKKWE